jgi:alkyl sulfatase BDS1-like metallo-beta-lactamase superfamily hydrolase
MTRVITLLTGTLLFLQGAGALADDVRNDATVSTQGANERVLTQLPFDNVEDFELADRGFIGRPDSLVVRDANGAVVWDMDRFAFASASGDAPATVNPSLWRQMQLNGRYGLYQVSDRIYQVRGYDISNLSVIVGDTGYIIVDPLLSEETARAAMELVYTHLPKKPIKAVIYSHSHADHFGGVKGVINESDVADGKTRVIASEGFMKHVVSENILAGNAMSRRVTYMFGNLLPIDQKGGVGVGLGPAVSAGHVTLIEPTDIVMTSGEEVSIDGVRMVFINAPHSEAPAELMFYLPDMKAFYAAEEANGTMHNLYTLRGAQVRDALLWSGYLHEAADLIDPETDILFGGHSWPRWGYDSIVEYLRKQGDAYRYLHDQTLRLANHGYTMDEISERIELPPELGQAWYNRGYYGSVSHNVRAVYNKYLGYFDANPATLHELPPAEAGRKYVEFMGGAKALLEKAQAAYDKAEYRWVAEVVNHLVFADPDNQAARKLQASALEQLGYQAESGQWRNFYLTGAQELRHGVQKAGTIRTVSPDMIAALSLKDFFSYSAVRLNGERAAGKHILLNFEFEDSGDRYLVDVSNGVLHHNANATSKEADATVRLSRQSLVALMLADIPVDPLTAAGSISIDGDAAALKELISLLDKFEFWFDIVTP